MTYQIFFPRGSLMSFVLGWLADRHIPLWHTTYTDFRYDNEPLTFSVCLHIPLPTPKPAG